MSKSCGIEFPHFGARYPDARCCDGYLWDMDSWDESLGGTNYYLVLDSLEQLPGLPKDEL